MSTAYAIIRQEHAANTDPKVRVVQIVWSEDEATDMVDRLNALSTRGPGGYSWQPTWVARPDREAGVVGLVSDDREKLKLAETHDALDTERPLAVFFSFIFNLTGARAACEELQTLGWPDVGIDEELDGDECWHLYAHQRRLFLNEESIIQLRAEMEDLAERHGGTFDGWDVSGGSLRWAKPGQLPA
jgi:Regulator of ribonuclease activity B